MNSKERHERRYRRRKAARDEKKKKYRTFKDVFTFENLWNAAHNCERNVMWKGSVQKFNSNLLTNVTSTKHKLLNNTYKAMKFAEFDLYERGKLRHIKSLHIKDRFVQKCLCDNCLVPLIKPRLIYDNAACLKDRGITFARNRLLVHLRKFYKTYGNDGYILTFDFKSYFDSIPHFGLIEMISKLNVDDKLLSLYSQLVKDFGDYKGVGLGSQISQISAVAYLNELDHSILNCYYGRYMDDGYILSNNKEQLKSILSNLIKLTNAKSITFNMKKTRISKLSKGFKYLKRRYVVKSNGKICIYVEKTAVIRERRKVKRLLKLGIAIKDILQSIRSWAESLKGTRHNYQISKIYSLIGGRNDTTRNIY